MKDFFKYVLATVVGILVVGLLCTIMMVISLIGMASSSSTTSVPSDAVVVFKLDGSISERTSDNPFAGMFGNKLMDEELGLDDILRAIKNAKENDKVKGIYMEAGSFGGATPAQLQEIRQALVDFKTSDKFIVAYGDQYTQGAYYLCSVADSVIINPEGMLDWKGLAMQTMYYKELMDKVGVKMEIFKVGTYKSAVEPYFLTEMSEANREQITVFSNEIWNQMLNEVSKSRKMTAEQLNQLTDSALTFQPAPLYKKIKLVDKLAYSDEVPRIIANMMGSDEEKPTDAYNTITIQDMAASTANEPKGTSGNIIAVYYADGEIVDAPSSGIFNGNEAQIIGSKTIKELQELADNDDVKAVVLRVNSPGGSAYASEQIHHAVQAIKAKKPVVVSMGGYAASGGYYISCGADYIFAEPTTLTGSIGIFGTFPVAAELMNNKIGLHISTVKTNEFADFGDYSREMTEGEKNALQSYVNRGYELFTKRCAEGRGMKQDDIKAIAEGRVWTGEHAKQIGLVDQLGNLDDAIAEAKKRAKVDEASVLSYPAKSNLFDDLMNEVSGDSYADAKLRDLLGEHYLYFRSLKNLNKHGNVQAQLPFYITFNL
ncbi:MAG: signal peptide peptidase SppA [Bacteroidales bacterium]|nr:signal peptide peptidase SppA [Bacteroidales bacterium]